MKKTLLVILLTILGIVGFLRFQMEQAKKPSKSKLNYAHEWVAQLAGCATLCDITNRFSYVVVSEQDDKTGHIPNHIGDLVLRSFSNGDWMVLHACDSHTDPNGGIMVTKDNRGAIRIFYGHVCGHETIFGANLEKAYRRFSGPSFDRREVFLEETKK